MVGRRRVLRSRQPAAGRSHRRRLLARHRHREARMSAALALRSAEIALAAYASVTIETREVHALIVDDPDMLWIGLQGTHDAAALVRDALAAFERSDPIFGTTPDSF